MATRKNVFIFQGYLVWHHTRQCQEVPCRVMIVLAVSVKKKKSPHFKKGHLQLWVGDQHSGGRPISWRYSRGNAVEVGQIKINHDDRMKKKWSWEDPFERLAGWINALNDKDTHLDPKSSENSTKKHMWKKSDHCLFFINLWWNAQTWGNVI